MFEMFVGFLEANAVWYALSTGLAAIALWAVNMLAKHDVARKLEAEFNEFLDDEPFEAPWAAGEN